MLDSKLEINQVTDTRQNTLNDLLKKTNDRTKNTKMQHDFLNYKIKSKFKI